MGSVGMLIACFVPWLVLDDTASRRMDLVGKLTEEGMHQIAAFHFRFGMAAIILSIGAIYGWLVQDRRIAGLMAMLGGGLSVWILADWSPVLGFGATLTLGLLAFGIASLLCLVGAVWVGQESVKPDHQEAVRDLIHRRLNPGEGDSKALDTFIITLIAINVLAVMFETEEEVAAEFHQVFFISEVFSTLVFTVEYLLRVYTSPLLMAKYPSHSSATVGRLKFALTPMALVDFVAILPFFLQFIQMDLRVARAVRLMRLVRIIKIGRYAYAVKTLADAMSRKKEELAIATFVTVMILILAASGMYFAEHEAQPEAFRSIPSTMWWAIVTLTSVGYGDVYPVTGVGQIVGAVVCLVGVIVVALPTGILASGFLEVMEERRKVLGRDLDEQGVHRCPHCGGGLSLAVTTEQVVEESD